MPGSKIFALTERNTYPSSFFSFEALSLVCLDTYLGSFSISAFLSSCLPSSSSPSPPSIMSTSPSKWMVLVASIWIEAFCGNPYQFYSSTLKTILGYNQLQLNILAVAKDTGENVGLLPGFLFNKIPIRATISVGASFAFLGYGVLWLVATQIIKPLPYWLMLIVIYVAGNSATWFHTAVLVTCMRNFPHTRGTIAGFVKGFVGLSSALYTQIFIAFISKDPVKLLFLLAVTPAGIALISMRFIRPVKSELLRDEVEEHKNFFFIRVLCILLTAYLFVATVVEDLIHLTNLLALRVVAVVTLLFLLVPVFIPIRLLVERLYDDDDDVEVTSEDPLVQHLISSNGNSGVSLLKQGQKFKGNMNSKTDGRSSHQRKTKGPWLCQLPDIIEIDEDAYFLALAEGAVQRKRRPRRGEDFKLKQALVKADFWLLFLAFFCGVGTGITAVNNLAQMAESQGYADVTIFVALLSIWNFLGRIGGGFVTEHYVRSAAVPRPVFMALSQALMIIAHILFAVAKPRSLHAASAILGICFGVQYSVMISTASELFGLKHFGIIYNFFSIATPLGSLLFSGLLAGFFYDQHTELGSSNVGIYIRAGNMFSIGTNEDCFGAECFRLTFLILAGVCIIGVILSIILSYRIRPVYQTLYSSHGLSSASLPPADLSSSSLPVAPFLPASNRASSPKAASISGEPHLIH